MTNRVVQWYSRSSRFERMLLTGAAAASFILAIALVLFAGFGDPVVRAVYEQRAPGVLNRLFSPQGAHPLEHYLALKDEIAVRVFVLWSLGCALAIPSVLIVYRFFFSGKPIHVFWLIFACCLFLVLLFSYNDRLRVASVHTFFYAGPVYQILNGNVPPMDPLFGGEVLHYQWGHGWAAAMVCRLLNVTPFTAFAILNIVSLAGCLWLLYKIAHLLTGNRSLGVFCAFFTIYCGTFLAWDTLAALENALPFYGGERRIFPLLTKFVNNNAATLGLFFFLLAAWGILNLFEKRKPFVYSLAVLAGATGTLFFYTAYGPGMLAWVGSIGLLWLLKYRRRDFAPFGRTLLLVCVLMTVSLGAVYPYLRQISDSGGFLTVAFFKPVFALRNLFSFLLPSSLAIGLIAMFRKHLLTNLHCQTFALLACLFVSNMGGYLFTHFPSGVEYKFMLLALVPFGLVAGVAFARVRDHSRWAALGLFLLVCLPSVQLGKYQLASSPQTVFDLRYSAPYIENGTVLESRDPEENELYEWIRDHTSMDRYFADQETKLPVYAQRSLWVAYETGQYLPGYAMTATRIKYMHGYDDQEFGRRQQVVQNLYGADRTLTAQEIAAHLSDSHIYVIVREDNLKIPLCTHGFEEVFASQTARFRVLAPADTVQ